MRLIKIYDAECSFFLGEACLHRSLLDPLPEFVLWRGRIYAQYHNDQYREIAIEPAYDKPSEGEDCGAKPVTPHST